MAKNVNLETREKNKGADQPMDAQLICASVFAYVKSRLSNEMAQMCQKDFPILIIWSRPLSIFGVLDGIFY